MRIQAAVLCDFAQVREGMLFVSSGGISRFHRPDQPFPLGIFLALLLEVGYEEIDRVHEVRVTVTRDGQAIGMGTAALQATAAQRDYLNPGEPAVVPVAMPLGNIVLPGHGMYDIRVSADGDVPEIRTVFVSDGPPQPERGA